MAEHGRRPAFPVARRQSGHASRQLPWPGSGGLGCLARHARWETRGAGPGWSRHDQCVAGPDGRVRVGTDGGGLNRVKPAACAVLAKARQLTIQSVCEDARGGLWFAINGGGVNYWKAGALQTFGADQGLTDLYVRSVF